MASEIRVNKIENRSGLGTVTFADTGVDLAGIVTATTFSGSGASLTSLPAANITGTLPAISAANLTNVPAANITGTLPAISAANLTNVPAANITGTLPAITAANLTNIPAANIVGVCTSGLTKTGGFGKILQVVSVFKGDRFQTTSTSFTDITDMSVTITPTAANSKILIQGSVNGGNNHANDYSGVVRTMRSIAGGSFSEDNKLNGVADGSRPRVTFRCLSNAANAYHNPTGFAFTGVDDPTYSVGNAIIYKLQVRNQSSSYAYILNGSEENQDADNVYNGRYMSSLIAMEISA